MGMGSCPSAEKTACGGAVSLHRSQAEDSPQAQDASKLKEPQEKRHVLSMRRMAAFRSLGAS